MSKKLTKTLGTLLTAAIVAQTAAVPTFAETATVPEYKENVLVNLNVSDTFDVTKSSTWGTQIGQYGLVEVDKNQGTFTTNGANGTISYDSEEKAIKIAHDDTKSGSLGLYLMNGFRMKDGYVDGTVKVTYDTQKTPSVPSNKIVAMLPGGKLQDGRLIVTNGMSVGYTLGDWLDYRIMYKCTGSKTNNANETIGIYDVALYTKKDGKYSLVKTSTGVELNNAKNPWGAWDNGGQVGTSYGVENDKVYVPDGKLYLKKAKVASIESGADSMFPQLVSMKETSDGLELKVNIALDEKSVTKENLDIPTGTVTAVSYADKTITIKGTGIKAAFLTENILSVDGMPAKTSSFETNVNDSTLMKLNINKDFETETTKAKVHNYGTGDVTVVPANTETGEREHLKLPVGRGIWGTQSVTSDGYFDLGLKLNGTPPSSGLSLRFEKKSGTLLRIDGGNWNGTGFTGLRANTTDWMDFRMLVKKGDNGNIWIKWLLKNEKGVYESLGEWTDTKVTILEGFFALGSDNGVDYSVSEFEYTNAAESTWYPEIIGHESYLDGNLLRIYTNRPLLGSTVNADSVILASGTATDFITSGNVITVVGEGLTTAKLTGMVATADGLCSGGKKASYTGGAVKHDCGTLTIKLEEALEDWEIAALSKANLTAGDSTVPANAVYSAENKTITLTFGDLKTLVTNNGRLEIAKYKINLSNISVDNLVELSDAPFEFLQISDTDTGSADTNGIWLASTVKATYKEATSSSRAYIEGVQETVKNDKGEDITQTPLYYGFTASGHGMDDPFWVDLAVDSTNGRTAVRVANAKDIVNTEKVGWPVIFEYTGNIKDKYPNAYVAADGFAEFRVALTKKANGGFEKTVYCKNEKGSYDVTGATEAWKTSAATQVAGGLNYLTVELGEGGKIAQVEIYKNDPTTLIPNCTEAKFENDTAIFTYDMPIYATDVNTNNIKAYSSEGEIADTTVTLSQDGKTITVAATDAIRVKVSGVHGKNGMPAADEEISRKLGADLTLTNQDGNIITQLKGVTKVSGTVKFKNKTTAEKKYTMYIAKYNNGTLKEVISSQEVTTAAGKWAEINASLTPATAFAEGDSVKAFVWDETQSPVCSAVTAHYSATTALAENALLKAKAADGALNVVYIGGSITQGTSASPNWVTLIGDSFKEAFGENVVTNYNAGVGGTTSQWGITRFDNDVLQKNPDVVFIEFAVNDAGISTKESQEAMEGMVRQLNALENAPLIAFVYTTTYSDNNAQTIAAQQEIADYYGITTINLRDYVWNTYWNGEAPTETQVNDFWVDKVHPTALGYTVYADYILANISSDGFFKETVKQEKPFIESYVKYVGNRLTDKEIGSNGYGWNVSNGKLTTNESGSLIEISFTGPMLVIRATATNDKGDVSISVDNGKIEKTLPCYYENGTASYTYSLFDLEDTEHTVTIESVENEERSAAHIEDIYVAKK